MRRGEGTERGGGGRGGGIQWSQFGQLLGNTVHTKVQGTGGSGEGGAGREGGGGALPHNAVDVLKFVKHLRKNIQVRNRRGSEP